MVVARESTAHVTSTLVAAGYADEGHDLTGGVDPAALLLPRTALPATVALVTMGVREHVRIGRCTSPGLCGLVVRHW